MQGFSTSVHPILRAARLLTLGTIISAAIVQTGCISEPDLPRLIELKPAADETRIEHVTLFDAHTATMKPDQTVVTRGPLIAWVGAATDASLPAPAADAIVVDGRGKFLLPGLIDAHVHIGGAGAPPWQLRLGNRQRTMDANLYAGVTTIFDLGGEIKAAKEFRDDLITGKHEGPNLFLAGLGFTAEGGHPAAMFRLFIPAIIRPFVINDLIFQIDDPESLDDAIARWKTMDADILKIFLDDIPLNVPRLQDEHIKKLVEAGHAAGVPVVAHVGAPDEAMRIARAGADAFAHTPYDGAFTPEEAAELAKAGVASMSTLGVWDRILDVAQRRVKLSEMEIAILDPVVREALEQIPEDVEEELPKEFVDWIKHLRDSAHAHGQNLKTLHDGGVKIVVATDTFNVANAGGESMHRELQKVVAAGIPVNVALQGATLNAAQVMRRADKFGSVEAGKLADLLLLSADPTADINNSRAIAGVYSRGREVQRVSK